ncbi:aminofutalosine synthase MqnE [Salipaludibacillus agaradhaerens]|uniref:Aminodeoxyfutalosine synthase n=1 Tax=Salipaludibacillus agaradhaerens TaxID=76935 RepID=A0A9Q4FXM5_SALAG|nr:aminofutalosine synthase MqnE [Salipaludibacillus agaradhaerens]MCR6111952.1 aminofutalosine synthase MqnE [Bacillus sp. A301a_S52]MCR6095267.1 aminofutalosine synthase MqnE [Salipaludibacillus agaradhaerens]MCR6107828.1 aminofutalosine synthase MqnE [Salipaludibacillus agaradhaerens]MCR6115175.1 aminofutalosine synthase MqnE [Salipaludibacillus agaradhaerens]MCR6119857.1 aminofutalosine synthase MqnE [Salipaludibacillus agaradhaerens]
MSTILLDHDLEDIKQKVLHGERLTIEDGLKLYDTADFLTVAQLANQVNEKKNGKNVYFIENMYINPTNVCEASCSFCGFKRKPGEDGAYTMDEEALLKYVEDRWNDNIQEFHIVGGHNTDVPFDYYLNTVRTLKKHYPQCTVKAYTGAEIEFFARHAGLSMREVMQELIKAGLDTLPGGGAEILTERYREKMSPDKASTYEWLEAHEIAHDLGLKTHATMLYGSIESKEERLIHMDRLRQLQDKTNGFMVFIPLAMQPRSVNAGLKRRTSAYDDLRTIAISRLMLDNFDHIKAYWINIGPQLTQMALTFGSSDIHGTLIEERISHSAGALTSQSLTRQELVHLIKGANKKPVERDTFYNIIKEY